MTHILLVGLGGFLGSIGRYLVGLLLNRSLQSHIPFATVVINLVGSFAVGFVLSWLNNSERPALYFLIVTGVLGGFTTYSAFSAETINLIQRQLYLPALGYVSLTLLGGMIFCYLGMVLAKFSI